MNAEWRMIGSFRGEKSLCKLEFNDLNIHLYLKLNYGTASEHLDFDFILLYNVFVLLWGFRRIAYAQYRISIGLVRPIPDSA